MTADKTMTRKNEDTMNPSSRSGGSRRVGSNILPSRREVVWSLSLASPVAGLVVGFGLLSEPSVYLGSLIAVSVLPVVAVVLAHAEARHSDGASVLGPAYLAVGIFCCYWLLLLAFASGDPTEFARDNASLFDGDGTT